jgi:hypothetical protein
LALYRNKEELSRIPYVEKRFYYDYYMRKLKKREESKKRRLKRAKRKLLKAMYAVAGDIKPGTKYTDIEPKIVEQTSKSNSVSLLSLDERTIMFQLFQSKLLNKENIEEFIMEFKDKKKISKKKKNSISKDHVDVHAPKAELEETKGNRQAVNGHSEMVEEKKKEEEPILVKNHEK